MSTQPHIVRKLIVEIEASTREEATDVQNRFYNEYRRLILQILEDLFNRLVSEKEVIRVEKLEINLGSIQPEQMLFEVPEKLKKEAEEAISKLLYEVRSAGNGSASVRMTGSSGETITVEASRESRSLAELDLLAHLLEFGVLPWTGDAQKKVNLRTLVANAMADEPEQLRQVLLRFKNKEYIFRRLAIQLPEDQLRYLASIIGSGFSSKLSEQIGELQQWIKALPDRLSKNESAAIAALQDAISRHYLWTETLLFFARSNQGQLSESTTEAARENYFVFLLKRLFEQVRFWEKISSALPAGKQISASVEKAFLSLVKEKTSVPAFIRKSPAGEKTGAASGKAASGKEKEETHLHKKTSAGKEEEMRSAKKNTAGKKKNAKEEKIKTSSLETDKPGEAAKKEQEAAKQKEIAARKKEATAREKETVPESPEADEGIYIGNAGLVILAPYLSRFFEHRGLVKDRKFISEESSWKAVHLLQYIAEGDDTPDKEHHEHELVLNKIFCGLDIAEPVPAVLELSAEDKEDATDLIKAVIANWPLIKNVSPHGFQSTFLHKEGKLMRQDKDWGLKIHRDSAVDMLIDRLPWGISIVRLPWMKTTVFTEW